MPVYAPVAGPSLEKSSLMNSTQSKSAPSANTIDGNAVSLPSRNNADRFAPVALLIFLFVEIIVFWILVPDQFGTMANLQTTLLSKSVLAILALAVLVPLIAGEFDVSLAMVFTAAMLVAGILLQAYDWPIWAAFLTAVIFATCCGAITGLLVIFTRAESLIVSLGMMILLRGVSEALTQGSTIVVSGETGETLRNLFTVSAGGTLPIILMLVVATLVWFVTELTPLGRKWYAIGGSTESARLLGLRTDWLRILSFAAGGTLAGVAAIAQLSASTTATASFGSGFLFPAIASAFLGAVAFRIGDFNVRGTVLSIFVLSVGITGIRMLGAPNWIDGVFYGVALIAAVATVQAVWSKK
jgi:ribose transport system permease protein